MEARQRQLQPQRLLPVQALLALLLQLQPLVAAVVEEEQVEAAGPRAGHMWLWPRAAPPSWSRPASCAAPPRRSGARATAVAAAVAVAAGLA